jgi:hypothetical protein
MSAIRQSDRAFGLTFAAVFAIISLVGWLVFEVRIIWAPVAASVILLVALAAPGILLPLNRLWARFSHQLGRFTNAVLLALFFFLFVLPFGLIIRLFGRDPMVRTFEAEAETYWTPVGRQCDRETLTDMF